jgi:hypothetical protein
VGERRNGFVAGFKWGLERTYEDLKQTSWKISSANFPSLERTYEDLKLVWPPPDVIFQFLRLERTYEDLKLPWVQDNRGFRLCLERTYENLKH